MNDDKNIDEVKPPIFSLQWLRQKSPDSIALPACFCLFIYGGYHIVLGYLSHQSGHEILRFVSLEFYAAALTTGRLANSMKIENFQLRLMLWWMSRLILFSGLAIFGFSASSNDF